MDEIWDVVIIGSGMGGLTAAACLASAGKRVLVLERHDLAGGNATVFRRHHQGDEYEFDVGVHYIGDCGPGGLFPSIFRSLGVGDRINFLPLDPDGFDTVVFPDVELRVPADWDTYRSRLIEAAPDDAAGIERIIHTLRTVADESRARMIPGVETATFDRWAFRPLSELFNECELSQRAIALIDHWSGLYAGPPSQTAVAMHAGIIDHYMRGAYYPEGGGQMLPARLIQVIEAFGGEVRTLSPVREITVATDGTGGIRTADGTGSADSAGTRHATGVVLSDGTTIAAPIVISNADHARTVRNLVAPEHWDPATLTWVDNAVTTLGLVCVYLVVDRDLTDRPNTNYHVCAGYDPEEIYSTLDAGEMPDETWVYIALASRKDPDNPHLCPPGHTNLQLMTLAPRGYGWWGIDTTPGDGGTYRRDPRYREQKSKLTELMIDAAETVLGPLHGHIVHMETATPITQERYTHSTGGTSYGYAHSPEQSGHDRPQHRTEIRGLWLTGANTVSGHGIAGAMVGGVRCAGEILDRPLLIEMIMGTNLVEPGTLPPDPADFDPMAYSRGARLRKRRQRDGRPS